MYLFLDRGEGREKEKERNIRVWLPLTLPLLGTWPTTQEGALTRDRTSDPLVCRPVLNPLSHSSQRHPNVNFKKRSKEGTQLPYDTLTQVPKWGPGRQHRYVP